MENNTVYFISELEELRAGKVRYYVDEFPRGIAEKLVEAYKMVKEAEATFDARGLLRGVKSLDDLSGDALDKYLQAHEHAVGLSERAYNRLFFGDNTEKLPIGYFSTTGKQYEEGSIVETDRVKLQRINQAPRRPLKSRH